MRSVGIVTGVFLSFWVAPLVLAQPGEPPPDRPGWKRERIETIIIGKFSSELDLTPEQAEKFFPRFRQYQNQIEELQRQQFARRRDLDDLSRNPRADQGMVRSLVETQSRQEERFSTLKREFLTDVSAFLTPQQVSRCAILLDEVPRRIREFIEENRRMHEGAGPPLGPAPGPPPRRRRGY